MRETRKERWRQGEREREREKLNEIQRNGKKGGERQNSRIVRPTEKYDAADKKILFCIIKFGR